VAVEPGPLAGAAIEDSEFPVNPATRVAPRPGPHGGDGDRLAQALGVDRSEVLDLSASLNPVAPDAAAVVGRHLDAVGRYPDPGPATAALARVMGADPDVVVLTNGGAEAIALVAAEQKVGWVDEPDFSLYRRHLERLDPAAPRWRSNPHNPTGLLAGPGEQAAVWDEAFWPLASGSWTRGDSNGGAIVLGSLTKLLACPGLRVGYVLCPDGGVARRVKARQPQWSVNGLAAGALPALLDTVDLATWAEAVAGLRRDLSALLRRAGFAPRPSDANWVLVESADLREHLATRAIAVRDCASFGLPGVVRVAVPDRVGLARLEAAL
jgi:histidinol-phosphate/aromatic aminotransferase/cobyric acid decarboxylase-like protein